MFNCALCDWSGCATVQYTLEELKEKVQASDAELLESLEQQQVCNVDGEGVVKVERAVVRAVRE